MRKFRRSGAFCVYILKCRGGVFYTGATNDLEKRIEEHNNSKRGAKYLRGKLPVKLVYTKEYKYYKNAIHAELKIKKLRRKQKNELVKIYAKESKKTKHTPADLSACGLQI